MDVARRHLLLDNAFDAARHGGFDHEIERLSDRIVVGCEYPVAITVRISDWAAGLYAVETEDLSLMARLSSEVLVSHLVVGDVQRVCGRAYSILRSMPTRPLDQFLDQTKTMPSSTEVERLVIQRVGQDVFRRALDDYWGAACPLTGITDRVLLRASHTVPWAECGSDADRLDVFNGFLLAVHIDAAFDAHLVTFDPEGSLVFSDRISARARDMITGSVINPSIKLDRRHERFLSGHRARAIGGAHAQTEDERKDGNEKGPDEWEVAQRLAQLITDEAGDEWSHMTRYLDNMALEKGVDVFWRGDGLEDWCRGFVQWAKLHRTGFDKPDLAGDLNSYEVAEELFWDVMPQR